MTRSSASGYDDGSRAGDRRRELDLFDLIAFVWSQKLFVLLWTLIVFLPLAALAWTTLKPSYVATSRLLVILDDEDITPGAAGSGGAFTLDQVLESETEILNSDAVRRRAIEARAATAAPGHLRAMRDGFSVSRAPNSSILTAHFKADDPQTAANTLNAIIEAYLVYRGDLLIGDPAGALSGRLDSAELAAARAEADLRNFLRDNALTDFETERASVLTRITDIQIRLMAAQAERDQARAFARALASRLEGMPQSIELFVENGVSGQLLDLQVRREELLARYQPDAPPVQAVEREITALRDFLSAGGGEGQGQRRTGVNPVWQELEAARLQQEALAAGQGQLAASLQAQLESARQEADRIRAVAPEYDRLQRASQARADAASRLSRQAAEASARRGAPPGAADAVRIVERAEPPTEARSMRRPALLAAAVAALGIGLFAGLIRGYLLSWNDRGPAPSRREPPRQPARGEDAKPPPDREPPGNKPADGPARRSRLRVLTRVPETALSAPR